MPGPNPQRHLVVNCVVDRAHLRFVPTRLYSHSSHKMVPTSLGELRLRLCDPLSQHRSGHQFAAQHKLPVHNWVGLALFVVCELKEQGTHNCSLLLCSQEQRIIVLEDGLSKFEVFASCEGDWLVKHVELLAVCLENVVVSAEGV